MGENKIETKAKDFDKIEIDKIQETLNVIENFKSVYHCFTACKETVNVSAIIRLIGLFIVWVNQFLVIFGYYTIPTLSDAEMYIIASGLTILVTGWTYWRNNSWSGTAKMSDAILTLLRDTNIDTYQLLDAIKTVVDEAHTKNKRELSTVIDRSHPPIFVSRDRDNNMKNTYDE